jgi:hypothetical protein
MVNGSGIIAVQCWCLNFCIVIVCIGGKYVINYLKYLKKKNDHCASDGGGRDVDVNLTAAADTELPAATRVAAESMQTNGPRARTA